MEGTPFERNSTMTCPVRVLLVLAAWLLVAGTVRGQTASESANLRGDSAQTLKRLIDARQNVLVGKHDEAIDELLRVLDDAGDDLISADGKQYRPARFVVHQILLTLPPEKLKAYQERVELPARKLLDAGLRDRDTRPLWQLVDRHFTSRPAGEGLLLLGDLLFERGQYRTAEVLWRRLLTLQPNHGWKSLLTDHADIIHPHGSRDPALVRARLVLAAAFQGEPERAHSELVRLAALHPGATGSIAGRDGNLVETLLPYVNKPPRAVSFEGDEHAWPTYAGNPGRTGRVPGRLPHHWPAQPTWVAPLFPRAPAQLLSVHSRQPFAHPIIVDGKVYISNESQLLCVDLQTGTQMGPGFEANAFDVKQQREPAFTLAAAERRVFTRFGPSLIRNPRDADESLITCFALAQRADAPKQIWQLASPVGSSEAWAGAPLVAHGRLWVASARIEGVSVVHSIACFDPVDPDVEPGRPAWNVAVCESNAPASMESAGSPRQELVTLAGRNVVFCSNSGVVVALSATTGQRAWAFKYPRAARQIAVAARSSEPCPAVADGDRVFLAPADADRVFALDAETGELLWESGVVHGAQILGVTQHRVIVSSTGPQRGIRGLNVVNGSHHMAAAGWLQQSGGGLATYGRGLVAENLVIWPTRQGLWFLDPETGRPLAQARTTLAPPRDGMFGNLAYADGVLVVVTPNEVWGYVAQNQPAPAAPARERFQERIGIVEQKLFDGHPAEAKAELRDVVRSDLPSAMRAWAAARWLLLEPNVPTSLATVLTPELEAEWVTLPDGSIQSLGQLVDAKSGRVRVALSTPGQPSNPWRGETPTLSINSRLKQGASFPVGSRPLLPVAGGRLRPRSAFAIAGQELLTVQLADGSIKRHAAVDTYTHAIEVPGGFIAVGPDVVAQYGAASEPCWVFRVPALDELPADLGRESVQVGEPAKPATLNSFTLAGTWLFARLGEFHLIALDLVTHRVGWVRGSHGRPGYEPRVFSDCPRFDPYFFADGQRLVAQLSDGRRWTIDAKTGGVLDASGSECIGTVPPAVGELTSHAPWVQAPLEIEPGRLAIADGPGLVHDVDLKNGKTTTLYSARGSSSLSGTPPQVLVRKSAILVAVTRIYGVEVDLAEFDAEPGDWHDPAFFDITHLELANADTDAVRAYLPAGDALHALKLRDGSLAWKAELPKTYGSAEWVARVGQNGVIVFPTAALPNVDVHETWERTMRSCLRHPFGARLPASAVGIYDAWLTRSVPVLLLEARTGKLMNRYDICSSGPLLNTWFEGDLAVVATSDGITRLK